MYKFFFGSASFLIFPLLIMAQNDTKRITDSSTITTKYFDYLNSVRVFNDLKNKNRSYYTEYYLHEKKLKVKGLFVDDQYFGIWKEYNSKGKLIIEIDYTAGKINYSDKAVYPMYSYQNNIKIKGDEIIKKKYSNAFFDKYIIWDIGQSYVYNGLESFNWIDNFSTKPTKFLLCYKLKFENIVYPEMIEFEIDSNGKFVKDFNILGFEQLKDKTPHIFNLTLNKAVEVAKTRGLKETNTNKARFTLIWEKNKSSNSINGHFRFYVFIKTKTIKDTHLNGRSTVIDKFDVYVINPWTAEFITKKKMQAIRGWELNSGSSTGLIDDN